MSLDIRSVILLVVFVLYGTGYMLTGLLNIQNTWTASLFRVPFIFAFFGMRMGRIFSGILCIVGGIWFFTLLM